MDSGVISEQERWEAKPDVIVHDQLTKEHTCFSSGPFSLLSDGSLSTYSKQQKCKDVPQKRTIFQPGDLDHNGIDIKDAEEYFDDAKQLLPLWMFLVREGEEKYSYQDLFCERFK